MAYGQVIHTEHTGPRGGGTLHATRADARAASATNRGLAGNAEVRETGGNDGSVPLSPATAIRITTRRYSFEVVRDAVAEYHPTVGSPRDAADIARKVIGSELSEVVITIMLDARHRVMGYTEVSRGTVNASRLTPRDVFLPAILSNAVAVVVGHNHPSGSTLPSAADHRVTRALREAGDLLGLPLLDHLIVTDSAHYSFRDEGGWVDQ
jgi:DNA repair protein RadC